MIFTELPENFNPRFEVVSCFCERNGQILLLRRLEHKSQGGRWGVPAGKVEAGEKLSAAIKREVWEETGLDLEESAFTDSSKVYVRYPDYDFVYNMFRTQLGRDQSVQIKEDEHSGYFWATPLQALHMPNLMLDADNCIKLFYQIT